MRRAALPFVAVAAGSLACAGLRPTAQGDEPEPPPAAPAQRSAGRPNFLVIVADDLGTDKLAAMGEAPNPPATPRLDALARDAVLFRNAYAYPTCSAARTAFLTGRYGRRNGMGGIVELDETTWEVPLAEVTLPEALDRGAPYAAAAVGKWHLSGHHTPSAFRHPLLQGFDHHRGSIGNLVLTSRDYGRLGGYHQFEKNVDGTPEWHVGYATTDTTDDAISFVRTLPEPWFLWVAYNAPHTPVAKPPAALRVDRGATTEAEEYRNVVTALDAEIGRLLDALTPEQRANTTIVFTADNGTDKDFVEPPFDGRRAKGTLFEGGTGVPLLVSGAGVVGAPRESAALVHAVDLLPTVVELAGGTTDGLTLDGLSFAEVLRDPDARGPRRYVYTERFAPVGAGPYEIDMMAIRDERYKLLVTRKGALQLFDLQGRHDDGDFVPFAQARGALAENGERLRRELDRITAELRFEY
jgi:arylsulfatase A-like enzyme